MYTTFVIFHNSLHLILAVQSCIPVSSWFDFDLSYKGLLKCNEVTPYFFSFDIIHPLKIVIILRIIYIL